MGVEVLHDLIRKMPERLKESYGFQDPFDYSKYESIEYPDYVYYPELSCIIMDGVEATWPKGTLDMDNPVHMEEVKERIRRRLTPGVIGIMRWLEPEHRMICITSGKAPDGFASVPVEETNLYYLPEEMDLRNDSALVLLAKCLFLVKRYEQVQIFPGTHEEPRFWEGN